MIQQIQQIQQINNVAGPEGLVELLSVGCSLLVWPLIPKVSEEGVM